MGKPILNMYFPGTQTKRGGYTFKVKEVTSDLGHPEYKNKEVHVRLQMFYNGLRVIGGDSVVHVNAADKTISGISMATINIIQTSASEISAAQSQMQSQTNSNVELVFYSDTARTTLAWDITKSGIAPDGTPMVVHYIVDTKKGTKLQQYSDTKTFHGTGWPEKNLTDEAEGVVASEEGFINDSSDFNCSLLEASDGPGKTMYSGLVTLSASFDGEHYTLQDIDRNCHRTVIASNPYLDPDDESHDVLEKLNNNVWGDRTFRDIYTSAADAHYGHAATYDFFKYVFERQGVYDDERVVYSRVHVGKDYCNAFWSNGRIAYGDGDGITFLPLVALEISTHEFAHGVTEKTAGLIYSGESGGLNEATSDIMSVLADSYSVYRGFYNPNYLIGDTIWIQPGRFRRSMFKPSSDIQLYIELAEEEGKKPPLDELGNPLGSYDCYCSAVKGIGVHFSSGVANHFFYLLAEGTINGRPSPTCEPLDCQVASGTKTLVGIGKEKAGKIWYRALKTQFVQTTNYAGARKGTIKAAEFLFGTNSKEVKAVKDAWAAVNVKGQ
jgi:Zn-dependent metalloprotease